MLWAPECFTWPVPNFLRNLPIAMFSFRVRFLLSAAGFLPKRRKWRWLFWVPWEHSEDTGRTSPHSSRHRSLGGYISSSLGERKMLNPSEVLRGDLMYHQKRWYQWNMGSSTSGGLNPSIRPSVNPSIHLYLQSEYLYRNNYVPCIVTGATGKGVRYNPCPWEPHGQTRETCRELITVPVRLRADVYHLYVKRWRGDNVTLKVISPALKWWIISLGIAGKPEKQLPKTPQWYSHQWPWTWALRRTNGEKCFPWLRDVLSSRPSEAAVMCLWENVPVLCVWASLPTHVVTSCFHRLLTCSTEIPRPRETHSLTRVKLHSKRHWQVWHVKQ